MKKKGLFILLLVFGLIFTFGCMDSGSSSGNNPGDQEFVRKNIEPDEFDSNTMAERPNDYLLVWADEFNYTGKPDASKWNYEVGAGGWGNNELQCYTNREENAYVDDGYLTITAKRENYSGSEYTSARITTKAKGDWKYGYIEMRAMLPEGVGTWPAFWLMPTDSVYGGWPNSGEIDIMETTGRNPNYIQGTVHTNVSGHEGSGGSTSITNSTSTWNTYAIEWTESAIKFLVNDRVYYTYNHLSNFDYKKWTFDQRFFVILNIAMGGSMGGSVSASFTEANMKVDYVRVYQQVDKTDTTKPDKPSIKKYLSSYNSITLEWDKVNDNQGIKQYDIVVDNKQIGATVSNRYVIKNLDPAKVYKVQIIAVDYNNNWTISDPVNIMTLSETTLPGKLYGHAYNEATQNVSIISGSDTGGGNVLQIPANTTVSYNVKCTTSGTYHLKLRLAATLSSTVKVEVYAGSSLIYVSEASVSRSYGQYSDVTFTDSMNLTQGELTIKLTCTSSTTGNALLLNYFQID